MGDVVWLRQGASHSPERHTTLLGAEISPSCVQASEAVQGREGESPPFFVPIQGQPIVGYTRPADFFKEMKLSPEQERKRLALWMGKGEVYDPRNEPDFDTFLYGTEPIPGDTTWTKEKAPDGALD